MCDRYLVAYVRGSGVHRAYEGAESAVACPFFAVHHPLKPVLAPVVLHYLAAHLRSYRPVRLLIVVAPAGLLDEDVSRHALGGAPYLGLGPLPFKRR